MKGSEEMMKEESLQKMVTRKILLNPGPATTSENVKMAQVISDICPREKEFGDLVEKVRRQCVDVVNGQKDYEAVLLCGSGTGAMEACLTSCTDQEDDEVVIISNGAYGKRMAAICEVFRIPHFVISFEWGDSIDLAEVKNHLKLRKNAKVLAFVHHETTVGILNPLGPLKSLADDFNLVTIVDAMSSYAGVEIDLQKEAVDYLISSSNKCIQGMAGIGIVIAKLDTLNKIKNYRPRSYYFNLYQNFLSQKEKKQFLFTPPVQTVYALQAALNEFEREGIKGRSERYSSLYQQMLEGMTDLGFQTLVEMKKHAKLLTAFLAPKTSLYDFEKMHDFLYDRGITIYPGKSAKENTFRISNIGDLSKEDIDYFLISMKDYTEASKIFLRAGDEKG